MVSRYELKHQTHQVGPFVSHQLHQFCMSTVYCRQKKNKLTLVNWSLSFAERDYKDDLLYLSRTVVGLVVCSVCILLKNRLFFLSLQKQYCMLKIISFFLPICFSVCQNTRRASHKGKKLQPLTNHSTEKVSQQEKRRLVQRNEWSLTS